MHECYKEKQLEMLEKHKDTANIFIGKVEAHLENLVNTIKDIKDNDIKHLNSKINGLLFTVLAFVIAAVIKWVLKV